MKIFGHPWIKYEKFYPVNSIDEIKETPPNSIVSIEPLPSTVELAKYCQANSLDYTLRVENIREAIFANLLKARYIISNRALAKELVPIAQNYLFDTEILVEISQEIEIEEIAKAGIDGAIFTKEIF